MPEVPIEDRPHTLYRFFAGDGRLLYIGITVNAVTRWVNHAWSKTWWPDVTDCKIEHHPNRTTALAAEKIAIITERPLHNIQHNSVQPGSLAPPLLPSVDLTEGLPIQYTQDVVEVLGREMSVALKWELQHGRMVCIGMRLATSAVHYNREYPKPEDLGDEPVPITTSMIRFLPFGEIARKQRIVLLDQISNEITVTDTAVRVRDKQAAPLPRGVRARAATAAKVYLEAQNKGNNAPTEAVAAMLDVSRSQASRYVRAARDAGLLPPA